VSEGASVLSSAGIVLPQLITLSALAGRYAESSTHWVLVYHAACRKESTTKRGHTDLADFFYLSLVLLVQLLLDRTQSRKVDGRPFVARSRGLLGVREAVRFARQHPR
jgi:hypothetical protein